MRVLETDQLIAAPPIDVWRLLVDVRGYPDWCSGVWEVRGDVACSSALGVYLDDLPATRLAVQTTQLEAPWAMAWRGWVMPSWIRCERTFRLLPTEEGTRFHMREQLRSPVMLLLGGHLSDLATSFETFATGLKQRAELAQGTLA